MSSLADCVVKYMACVPGYPSNKLHHVRGDGSTSVGLGGDRRMTTTDTRS